MEFLFIYLIIIFSAVFHEYAHGWAAKELGDDTAERAGRLTLNPISHIDPIGTVALPVFLMLTSGIFIGWAKPVPYNPYNLTDKKFGNLKVAIAGPASNLIIALIIGLFLRFFASPLIFSGFMSPDLAELLMLVVYINIILTLFNLIPVPPLDGSKILADLIPAYWRLMPHIGLFGIFIALFIAFYLLAPLAQGVFSIIVGTPI